MTLVQARALLKVHEEITFTGVQEFARLTDEDAAAWTELVRCATKIVAWDQLDRLNSKGAS